MKLLSLTIPSLRDVLQDTKRAFNAEFRQYDLDAFRRNNLLYPLTNVVGYLLAQVWPRAREYASQAAPFGATGANLEAWLELYSVEVPGPAQATGTILVTGRNNYVLPAGSAATRLDGLGFTTTAVVHFGALEETIAVGVIADETGSEYNTEAGAELELAPFSDDLDPAGIVETGGITGGSDPADDDAKAQLLQTRLAQGQGAGTANDYRLKALGFSASIARVFVEEAGLGPGTVVVFFLNVNPDGSPSYTLTLPSAGEVSALQTFLEQPDVRRVNDVIVVRAPTLVDVDLSIALTPNTAEVQSSVEEALRFRFADFYDTGGYTIPNSEISAAIAGADGEISHTLLDVGGGGPDAAAVAAFGEILQLGTITFSAEA